MLFAAEEESEATGGGSTKTSIAPETSEHAVTVELSNTLTVTSSLLLKDEVIKVLEALLACEVVPLTINS